MRQVLTLMRQDMTNSLRDNIIVYIILVPLLLAVAVKAFFPTFEASGLSFAVEAGVNREIIAGLKQYGTVEIIEGEPAVLSRVEKVDAVPGIIAGKEGVILIIEGNEPKSLVDSYTNILTMVTSREKVVSMEHRIVGSKERSLIYEYIIVMLTMMIIFMGAVVSGFNIIHDRETRALQAITVSPVRTGDFLVARGAMAVGVSMAVALLNSLILAGVGINYLQLIIVLLVSALLTTLLSLVLGTFADNQITAIAVVKVLMPLYMFLPLVSLFVSEKHRFIFYPLPNYWQFKMLQDIFIGGEAFGRAALLTLVTSVLFFLVLVPIFRKKLKLR